MMGNMKLFELKENMYSEGSGVVITSGTLLTNAENNAVVVQLKFKNITSQRITGLQVSLDCFDGAGEKQRGVENFKYSFLFASSNEEFGDKVFIDVPNSDTRSFAVKECTVYCEGGTELTSGSEWKPLKPVELKRGSFEFKKQYRIEFGENAKYLYDEYLDLWYCVCGSINREEDSNCPCCKIRRDLVSSMDDEQIMDKMQERVSIETENEKQRQFEEDNRRREKAILESIKDEKIAKMKKTVLIIAASILAVFIVLVLVVGVPFGKNFMMYLDAKGNMEDGLYDDAKAKFEYLDGFLDAETMVYEAHYQNAAAFAEEGKYDRAIELWEEIIDYSDSRERILQATDDWFGPDYQAALALMDETRYLEAYDAFVALDDYKDSASKKEECVELEKQMVTKKMEEDDYQAAFDIVNCLKDEKYNCDVEELYIEVCYGYACYAEKQEEYGTAIEYFKLVPGYKDADDRVIRVSYWYGTLLASRGEYAAAVDAFLGCPGYQDADEQVLEAKYEYVREHRDSPDNRTYNYLINLKKVNYRDSKWLFSEIYKWEMEVTAFNNSISSSTDRESVSKSSPWYCHVKLRGGAPGAQTVVSFRGEFPGGSTYSGTWDGAMERGDTAYCSFYFDTPHLAPTGIFTIRFYDEDGNLIGQDSVRVTE